MSPGIKCQPGLIFYISDSCLGKSRMEMVKQGCCPLHCIAMRVPYGRDVGAVKLETEVGVEEPLEALSIEGC